jgi:hypothetical protein
MKGLERLRSKLPAYDGNKAAFFPLLFLSVTTLDFFVQIFFDFLPRLIPSSLMLQQAEPVFTVIGSFVVSAAALLLVSGLWRRRDEMKNRHGDLAYQKMLPQGGAGVSFALSLVLHSFVSVRSLPPYSLVFFIIVFCTFRIHIYVEERELISRFGERYEDYMREVPGLYVRLKDVRMFLYYLLGR